MLNKGIRSSMNTTPMGMEVPFRDEESIGQNESEMLRQYGEFVTDVNCPMSLLANVLVDKLMPNEPHLDDQQED